MVNMIQFEIISMLPALKFGKSWDIKSKGSILSLLPRWIITYFNEYDKCYLKNGLIIS